MTAKSEQSWRGEKGSASERGYTWAWKKARDAYLREHPLCAYCEERGKYELATLVDHRIPHRGDQKLFWDQKNWASSCRPCHDRDKQRLEKSGVVLGCDANGEPLDPDSHWK